jgi:drug/metabolite transporter (DMT)-like permease
LANETTRAAAQAATKVATQAGRPAPDLWKAVFWAIVALLAFTLTAISGREAGRDGHVSAMHMVFYRNALSLIILLVVFRYLGVSLASLRTQQPWLQWGRALIHFLGQWSWMAALLMIPLIELMALEFTFPLIVALLAPFMLGELLTRARVVAAVLGFIGTLTIILGPYLLQRPGEIGGPSFNAGTLLAALCAICFALNLIGTRYLTRKDGPLTILMFMVVNHTVLAFILGFSTMKMPPTWVVPWLVLLGVSSLVAHFALARALAYADAVIVATLDFLRIPLMAGLGVLVYHEPLHMIALIGTALVLSGNIVNVWGERNTMMAKRKG